MKATTRVPGVSWPARCCGARCARRAVPGRREAPPAPRHQRPRQGVVRSRTRPTGLASGSARAKPVRRARSREARAREEAALPRWPRRPARAHADDGRRRSGHRRFALRPRSRSRRRAPATRSTARSRRRRGPLAAGGERRRQRSDVLRYMPEGEVPLAPHLSVTFNQPMVAMTSHADTVADGRAGEAHAAAEGQLAVDRHEHPPVRSRDPLSRGDEVRGRGPGRHAQRIRRRARKAARFTFETPAPVLSQMWPPSGPPQQLDVLMFVVFDQKIDAEAVLATIKIKTDGGVTRVRRATPEEIAEEPEVRRLIEAENEAEHQGRHVAFKPVALLPGNSAIQVAVGPDTPSAEGPRRTTSSQGWSFHTFGPLKVVQQDCPAGQACPPGSPFTLVFSNALDEESFDQAALRIEPELPGLEATVVQERLVISGAATARTRYQVTVPASLRDRSSRGSARRRHSASRSARQARSFSGPAGSRCSIRRAESRPMPSIRSTSRRSTSPCTGSRRATGRRSCASRRATLAGRCGRRARRSSTAASR